MSVLLHLNRTILKKILKKCKYYKLGCGTWFIPDLYLMCVYEYKFVCAYHGGPTRPLWQPASWLHKQEVQVNAVDRGAWWWLCVGTALPPVRSGADRRRWSGCFPPAARCWLHRTLTSLLNAKRTWVSLTVWISFNFFILIFYLILQQFSKFCIFTNTASNIIDFLHNVWM